MNAARRWLAERRPPRHHPELPAWGTLQQASQLGLELWPPHAGSPATAVALDRAEESGELELPAPSVRLGDAHLDPRTLVWWPVWVSPATRRELDGHWRPRRGADGDDHARRWLGPDRQHAACGCRWRRSTGLVSGDVLEECPPHARATAAPHYWGRAPWYTELEAAVDELRRERRAARRAELLERARREFAARVGMPVEYLEPTLTVMIEVCVDQALELEDMAGVTMIPGSRVLHLDDAEVEVVTDHDGVTVRATVPTTVETVNIRGVIDLDGARGDMLAWGAGEEE